MALLSVAPSQVKRLQRGSEQNEACSTWIDIWGPFGRARIKASDFSASSTNPEIKGGLLGFVVHDLTATYLHIEVLEDVAQNRQMRIVPHGLYFNSVNVVCKIEIPYTVLNYHFLSVDIDIAKHFTQINLAFVLFNH